MEHQESKDDMFEKFTWKIENFSRLNIERLCSETFILGGYPWRIILYPEGNVISKNVDLSIFLEAMQSANMSKGWSRDVKFRLVIFNQVNSDMTITKETVHEFNASAVVLGFASFMPLAEFRDPHKGFLMEDACIVGVEISLYKTTHENPVNFWFVEMEHQESKDDMFEKFTWKIENFSRLNMDKLYSEPFILGGYPWRIILFPQGNGEKSKNGDLSIYLDAMQSANMSKGWSRGVKFRLVVFNQVNSDMTIAKETFHEFNASEEDWGFTYYMPLVDFRDPHKGFLVEDACIFGADIFVCKTTNENPVNQATLTSGGQIGHMEVKIPKSEPEDQAQNLETLSPIPTLVCNEPTKHTDVDLFSASIGELMDFRDFGQIEKAFIPLLEEVCSHHPSLIECQQKRSRKFTAWAFTALGRVLYFLKTRKVKDMNEVGCKDLQILWEELETCRFDLAWLGPHVQSILATKNYAEKTTQVKKRKENVVALELETERLKAKSIIAQVNLDAARDVLKALDAENFEEKDLDAELGYGSP